MPYPRAMQRPAADFRARYGPWAVVAGASEGLGAAFAEALAERGVHLVLVARRAALLAEVASRLQTTHGVEVRCLALDLADPGFAAALGEACSDVELGLLVYNAAFSPIGAFLEQSAEDLARVVALNVHGPLRFVHRLAPPLRARGRGGVVLMSSLAGVQGSPRIAAYAASKAFNTILAEGLWGELRADGVDVVASCAGAIRTPGYQQSSETAAREAPGALDPAEVAERTLAALGRGPRVVPGWVNRIAHFVNSRMLTRRAAVRLMAANTRDLS